MNNFGYIYKTTNLITNQIYIGKKMGKFEYKYFGSGIYLKRAIKKFGKYVFKIEIITYCQNKNELNNFEKYFIAKYRNLLGKKELYNLADGGEGGNLWAGGHPPISYRERLRLNWLGNKNPMKNPKIVKKIALSKLGSNNYMYGKHFKHTEETKNKCRLAVLGDKNPAKRLEVKEKLRKYMLGRKRGKYQRHTSGAEIFRC